MDIEKKAEAYYRYLSKPLADEEGLVVTAYTVGALDQLNDLQQKINKKCFFDFVGDTHPDPDHFISKNILGAEKEIEKLVCEYLNKLLNDL